MLAAKFRLALIELAQQGWPGEQVGGDREAGGDPSRQVIDRQQRDERHAGAHQEQPQGQRNPYRVRRSGGHVYRPHCRDCMRCIPVRVPVADFRTSRSQRRCLDANADLQLTLETRLGDEHYALYRSYLLGRHADGGMDPYDRQAFHTFLECPWAPVHFWCFRERGRLLSVAVVDHLPLALSAVYTFFDPEESSRSLGTLAVLHQIRHAQARGLPHVYLGYWVPESRKMAYKHRFRPLETLTPRGWVETEHPDGAG